jgi:hypothetical protein
VNLLLTEVPFVFPTEQRVLTLEEYQALGYIPIGDVAAAKLSTKADKPLSYGYDAPAYRAETQEEALIDIGVGIVKIGYALATGGVGPTVNTTLGYTWSLLT